ncbi:hypothetical protein HanRHA438_Chr03g0108921 [Helianthus annuus]|nr:hypothetical protein HanRHA438_Chr03g0108921 [Helianthus annuus]
MFRFFGVSKANGIYEIWRLGFCVRDFTLIKFGVLYIMAFLLGMVCDFCFFRFIS